MEKEIARWVYEYNNNRYHERIDNVTPSDKYYGKAEDILNRRKAIKKLTLQSRKMYHQCKIFDNEFELN